MPIRRGEDWGEQVDVPAGLAIADSDAAARDLVLRGSRTFGVRSGDLARTMGGSMPGRFDGPVVRAPVDLLQVRADGEDTVAVAHVVVRRRWWRGAVVLAMNAQFLGPFDVAPRSHPNDGRVDVLRVDPAMGLRARLAARRRSRIGAHLPHPLLTTSHVARYSLEMERPATVWVDGVRWRTARRVEVAVEPDALTVHA